LTLYTTPVIYIFFDNLGARFSRRSSKTKAAQAEGGSPQQQGGAV
jgi:multidrug efflux pump